MSNYPIWWDSTVTVYNKFEDPSTNLVKWYRTVIPNCFWKYTGEKVTVGTTIIESDTTTCRIPQDSRFKFRYEWDVLPNVDMPNYFTLGVGDIIILGEVDDEINEYKQGHRSSDILIKHKSRGCIVVKSVAVNVGVGRVTPHYKVSGE